MAQAPIMATVPDNVSPSLDGRQCRSPKAALGFPQGTCFSAASSGVNSKKSHGPGTNNGNCTRQGQPIFRWASVPLSESGKVLKENLGFPQGTLELNMRKTQKIVNSQGWGYLPCLEDFEP
jgi:hypothetical protein